MSLEQNVRDIQKSLEDFLKAQKNYVITGGKAFEKYINIISIADENDLVDPDYISLDYDIIIPNNKKESKPDQILKFVETFVNKYNIKKKYGPYLDAKELLGSPESGLIYHVTYNNIGIFDVHVEDKLPAFNTLNGLRVASLDYMLDDYLVKSEGYGTKKQKRKKRGYMLTKIKNNPFTKYSSNELITEVCKNCDEFDFMDIEEPITKASCFEQKDFCEPYLPKKTIMFNKPKPTTSRYSDESEVVS